MKIPHPFCINLSMRPRTPGFRRRIPVFHAGSSGIRRARVHGRANRIPREIFRHAPGYHKNRRSRESAKPRKTESLIICPAEANLSPLKTKAIFPEDLRLAYKVLKNADCLPPETSSIRREIQQMEDTAGQASLTKRKDTTSSRRSITRS